MLSSCRRTVGAAAPNTPPGLGTILPVWLCRNLHNLQITKIYTIVMWDFGNWIMLRMLRIGFPILVKSSELTKICYACYVCYVSLGYIHNIHLLN